MNEHALIESIKRKCPSNASVILGIDDDAAVIRPTQREGLVCTDMLMDGVHFLSKEAHASAIGHKALAVNLSDIAAMGGRALSAYVSLALPRDFAANGFVDEFYQGLTELAQSFDVAIAGGDTNIWKGPLVVNVTVFGEAHAKGPVLRSGATVGDHVFVTGPLGGSLAGHHLSFTPRLREARDLMDQYHPTSMMDVSDGLAKDLREIARLSGVAIYLNKASVLIQNKIASSAKALEKAMTDGEDFELCFTLNSEDAKKIQDDSKFSYCRRIGEVRSGDGLFWTEGKAIDLQGYQHK